MRVPKDVECREGVEGPLADIGAYLSGGCVAADNLGHFDIEQRRRVQRVVRDETLSNGTRQGQAQQPFYGGR